MLARVARSFLKGIVMSQSLLTHLAQLMLKAQHEFTDSLNAHAAGRQPLQMGLTLGKTSVLTRWSAGQSKEDGLQMTVSENGNTYRLHVPARADAKDGVKVSVKLETADGKTQEHTFEGAKLMAARFDGAFADLHAKVMSYLKKTLGAEGLKNLKLDADSSVQTGAQTSAPDEGEAVTAADSSAPAQADAQGAAAAEVDAADAEYRWFRIHRNDQADLRFKGKLAAHAQSTMRQGRQHLYSVFVTPSGKAVAIKEGLSVWLNERNLAEVAVLGRVEDCVSFFGYNGLAKAIYQQLGLSAHAEEVLE